jgi:hypothetical protein
MANNRVFRDANYINNCADFEQLFCCALRRWLGKSKAFFNPSIEIGVGHR